MSAIPARVAQKQPGKLAILAVALLVFCASSPASSKSSLEATRPGRPWEFLSATGTRAALLGNEAGEFEAWVYPLKILRGLELRFHTEGRVLLASTLARTLTVRPESSTILYAGDSFQLKETLFAPVKEPGALILLEVSTSQPLEIEVAFRRDFQLMWPAALGGTYVNWDAELHAFSLGEEQKKYAALVGSPTGSLLRMEYSTNSSSSGENSFLLGTVEKGTETKVVAIAGSVARASEAETTYRKLCSKYSDLLHESAQYYREYLDNTVSLDLPDPALQQAYDWARVSTIQGLVTNPYLGTGLVAGYRTSGESQRPGFAWFFGRDSFWTSFALNAEGDFSTTKTALDFVSKFQRADGKVPHEISQSATLVPWFTGFPYAYASADATPLFIIAMNDYANGSGDVAFVNEKWQALWKAYEFLKSTYDAQGLPRNLGVGHGWIEGGPLVPVETELYQSALGAEALHALANLARLSGKEGVAKQLDAEFDRQKQLVNQAFWSDTKHSFVFALDKNNQPVEIPTVLSTVPMWFGLLDEAKSEATINTLAGPDQQADWGLRIISSQDPHYGPNGYHFGSVWPLFTGWAAVGEYRYHRPLAGYGNLRANALLALDGSLGHVTEVLSGDYYEPVATSSPHQIWSAAMVISPVLRGMFGLQTDANSKQLVFAPHIPATWDHFSVKNIRVGTTKLDFRYKRAVDSITLEIQSTGDCTVEFSPAISLRTGVVRALVNNRPVQRRMASNSQDQHVVVILKVPAGATTLKISLEDDFDLELTSELPPLGRTSQGLRILSQQWSADRGTLTVETAGLAGRQYELAVRSSSRIAQVEGGGLSGPAESLRIQLSFPRTDSSEYASKKLVIHFGADSRH